MSPSTRKLFSYVPQGNTMFSGTIAENMRNVKPDATDEEIIEALKLSCAWDFVEKLPNGIQSVVKERGGGFSEGQHRDFLLQEHFSVSLRSFSWMRQLLHLMLPPKERFSRISCRIPIQEPVL